MKIIARFEVPYYQYLNEESKIVSDPPPAILKDKEALTTLYKLMVLIRAMDAKAIALQRTGKLGTYPSTRGQEAVFVGVGKAMEKKDILVPYYRDLGTLFVRGVKLSEILLYWGGDERGNLFANAPHDFPFSVPVGSQGLHAAGAAFALKYRGEKQSVLTLCGDGATSQGDFYEAMNVAGAWQLPVVFVVCNNQWAISVSREAQTSTETLAQKAIAAGFEGEQIDGNDISAVYERTQRALQEAREHGRPKLLEMVCYRQHDHTTADDASRYEPSNLREQEWKKEPIARLRHFMEAQGYWDKKQEEALEKSCAEEVEQAVTDYLNVAAQPLTSMFDHLYESLPETYASQREALATMELKRHG